MNSVIQEHIVLSARMEPITQETGEDLSLTAVKLKWRLKLMKSNEPLPEEDDRILAEMTRDAWMYWDENQEWIAQWEAQQEDYDASQDT